MKKFIGIIILSILNPFNLFLLTLFVGKNGWTRLVRENYSINNPVNYDFIFRSLGYSTISFFMTMLLISAFFRKLYEVDSLLLNYLVSALLLGLLFFFLLVIFNNHYKTA